LDLLVDLLVEGIAFGFSLKCKILFFCNRGMRQQLSSHCFKIIMADVKEASKNGIVISDYKGELLVKPTERTPSHRWSTQKDGGLPLNTWHRATSRLTKGIMVVMIVVMVLMIGGDDGGGGDDVEDEEDAEDEGNPGIALPTHHLTTSGRI